jgi:Uma2 family endonuclease
MSIVPDTATTVVRASHVPGPPQGQWTYADYAALPDADGFRYEILHGVLYMAPAPIPEHERLVSLIGARLVAVVEDTGQGQVLASPDIDVGGHTLRPDTVVVLNANEGVVAEKRLIGPPDLVVEIASPSTATYDRDPVEGKRAAYAQIGVREYWIVEPAARTIEVFVLVNDEYAAQGAFSGDDLLPSQVLPDLAIPASQFFPRAPRV